MKPFIHQKFLQLIATIVKFIAIFHVPFNIKLVTGADFHTCQSLIKPGMLILSRTDGELANVGIPGFWHHIGVVTETLTICEAVTTNVRESDLYTFFLSKDYVCVVDPNFLTAEERAKGIKWALTNIGKAYNFDMSVSGVKTLFCSELAYLNLLACKDLFYPEQLETESDDAYDIRLAKFWEDASKAIPLQIVTSMGLDIVTPNAFWADSKNFNCIFVSDAAKNALRDLK